MVFSFPSLYSPSISSYLFFLVSRPVVKRLLLTHVSLTDLRKEGQVFRVKEKPGFEFHNFCSPRKRGTTRREYGVNAHCGCCCCDCKAKREVQGGPEVRGQAWTVEPKLSSSFNIFISWLGMGRVPDQSKTLTSKVRLVYEETVTGKITFGRVGRGTRVGEPKMVLYTCDYAFIETHTAETHLFHFLKRRSRFG